MFDDVLGLIQLLTKCSDNIDFSYFSEEESAAISYESRLEALIATLEEIKVDDLSQKVEILLEKAKKELQQEQDRLHVGYQEFLKLAEIPHKAD